MEEMAQNQETYVKSSHGKGKVKERFMSTVGMMPKKASDELVAELTGINISSKINNANAKKVYIEVNDHRELGLDEEMEPMRFNTQDDRYNCDLNSEDSLLEEKN